MNIQPINGFAWNFQDRGIHTFSRKLEVGKYEVIECTTQQLSNGDIQFMTQHGLTISAERKAYIQREYDRPKFYAKIYRI